MAIQLIKVGSEQFVLLPLNDYERLAKAAKLHAADFRKPIPVAELNDLVPNPQLGESKLRAWRKHRGLTLEELAALVGKTKGFLSEIETGNAFGKPALWWKLAQALNTEIEAILPEGD